jgi:hypothetical protein
MKRSCYECLYAITTRSSAGVVTVQTAQPGLGQPDTPERHRLFRDLKKELELHAEVEHLHVYRVFQQVEATRDEAAQALDAHRKIKTLLDELEAAPAYDHKWISKFQDLQKAVEQHVATEENEMFHKAEGVLTPQEAEELGVKVETAKRAISRDAPTTEGGTPERT